MERKVTPNIKKLYEEQQKTRKEFVKHLVQRLTNGVVYVNDYKYKSYKKNVVDYYYDALKEGIEYDVLRHAQIPFRFTKEGDIHTLPLTRFITHVIMWSAIVRIGRQKLSEDHLMDLSMTNQRLVKGFIDTFIIKPNIGHISMAKLNTYLHDMLFKLGKISEDFNDIMGLSISMETFIDLSNRYEEFDDILATKIDEDMQPVEIEDFLEERTKRQVEIIANDPQHNDLKPLIRSGTGIRVDQFKEFAVGGGLKPDLVGNTIPIPVNSNFITGGLNTISNYYIDAKGGRKSPIMNVTVMGSSGHFARLMMLVGSDVVLSGEDNCASVHSALIEIDSEVTLDQLEGRKYKLPHERSYSTISTDDTHLIGEIISLRSPALCATSPRICNTCYGDLHLINVDLESVGSYGATEITEPVTQSILSTKHLLNTQSEKISFPEEYFNYFILSSNEVMLNRETEIDTDSWSLVIYKDKINKLEEPDDSGIDRFIKQFSLVNKKTGETIKIREDDGKDMFLSPELEDIIKGSGRGRRRKDSKNRITIPLSSIGYEDRIFMIEISNNELTKPLYEIMSLLDSVEFRENNGITSVSDMIQHMLRLLDVSGIPAKSIHAEIIMSALVRSRDDILKKPNFHRYDAQRNINILSIHNALRNHPSVLVSLAFQEMRKQLLSPTTYRKTGSSYIDPYFRKRLD